MAAAKATTVVLRSSRTAWRATTNGMSGES
jgi:hypothetical protein